MLLSSRHKVIAMVHEGTTRPGSQQSWHPAPKFSRKNRCDFRGVLTQNDQRRFQPDLHKQSCPEGRSSLNLKLGWLIVLQVFHTNRSFSRSLPFRKCYPTDFLTFSAFPEIVAPLSWNPDLWTSSWSPMNFRCGNLSWTGVPSPAPSSGSRNI